LPKETWTRRCEPTKAPSGAKIDAIPRDQFMNAQPEEIIDHILVCDDG
jgi:hypothetical protein